MRPRLLHGHFAAANFAAHLCYGPQSRSTSKIDNLLPSVIIMKRAAEGPILERKDPQEEKIRSECPLGAKEPIGREVRFKSEL